MLEINNLSINIKEHKYLENFNLVLNKYDKACIIGEEGNGKSTILKVILNKANYASINGNVNIHDALIGYLPQKIEFTGLVYDYLFYIISKQKTHKSSACWMNASSPNYLYIF